MPTLKTGAPITVIPVSYHDWDTFVQEVYGQDYEIVADQELSNDSDFAITARKEPLDKWAIRDLTSFVAGGQNQWVTHKLVTDMCNRGLLPEGEYLISICW